MRDEQRSGHHMTASAPDTAHGDDEHRLPDLPTADFGSFLDALPDGVVITGPAGEIRHVNIALARQFGYEPTELAGQNVEILVPALQAGKHARLRERYQQDPHARQMGAGRVLQAARKDGSIFPVEIALSPIHDAEGAGTIATVRDVTDRIELQRLLDATEDGLFVFDGETLVISHANQGMADELGVDVSEIVGRTPLRFCTEYDEVEYRDLIAPLLVEEISVLRFSAVHQTTHGEVVLDVSMEAPALEGATKRSVVTHTRNASARIEAQRQIRRSERFRTIAEERERIGRDMYDTVVQDLFAIGLGLEATAARTEDDDLRSRLVDAATRLDQTIDNIRLTVLDGTNDTSDVELIRRNTTDL